MSDRRNLQLRLETAQPKISIHADDDADAKQLLLTQQLAGIMLRE